MRALASPTFDRLRSSRVLPASLALLFGALTLTISWLRWSSCHNHTFDLALYARSAWGLARGDMWNPIADASFVHLHAAWILIPLGLLGRMLGTVPVLLSAQAIAIAACAWPLSRIAERHLGMPGAWCAVLLWIAYPNLGHVGSYEMHPGTLALLPLCWALDAVDRGDATHLLWSTLGVLACRADYALITTLMGVVIAKRSPLEVDATQRRSRIAVIAFSILYLTGIVGLQRLWPAHGVSSAELHFGTWGGSPLGMVSALFTDPARVVDHVWQSTRISYLPRVLLPLSLLPLLQPRLLLIAAPVLAINLISTWPTATRLDSHYLTPAVPTLLVAALIGFAQLRRRFRRAAWIVAIAPLVASAWCGGLPWSRDFPTHDMTRDARSESCTAVVTKLDPDASLQAPDYLLPHVVERCALHRAPPPDRVSAYVVLDVSHRQRFAHQETLLRTQEEPLVRTWLARDDHRVVHADRFVIALERGHDPLSGWSQRYVDNTAPSNRTSGTRLTGCLSITDASRHDDTLRLSLIAHGPCAPDLAIRFGANAKPQRVDLLFDGVLSPKHLREGARFVSTHALSRTEVATIDSQGLWLGALRSSGARPEPQDPFSVRIPLKKAR